MWGLLIIWLSMDDMEGRGNFQLNVESNRM